MVTKLVYHGGKDYLTHGKPKFFAVNKEDAEWYAIERAKGQIYEILVTLEYPAKHEDVIRITKEIGVSQKGENPNDFVYDKRIRDELVRQGYDGFEGWDVLENTEIPIIIAFYDSQIKEV